VSAATAPAAFELGEAIALRPGLRLPDWSRLSDPRAREALAASMAVAGRREKWAGLDTAEDEVRRAVLRHFAARGVGPSLREVAAATGRTEDVALALLHRLRRRDLLVFDTAQGTVAACYPFSTAPTPHRLLLGPSTRPLYALCAIDALGAGGMLGVDATVQARCAHCGAPVTVQTSDGGQGLASVEPKDSFVWSGIRYEDGCAATSGCAVKPFFCSEAHLEAWRAKADPGGPGYKLPVLLALQVGLALFGPMLHAEA
jgi:Alkylmercury lyase